MVCISSSVEQATIRKIRRPLAGCGLLEGAEKAEAYPLDSGAPSGTVEADLSDAYPFDSDVPLGTTGADISEAPPWGSEISLEASGADIAEASPFEVGVPPLGRVVKGA